jgi:septum formation protein
MPQHHPRVYLASKSPRRQELLRSANIDFELLDVEVEEIYPDNLPAEEIAEYLARKKAEAAIPLLKEDGLVLAADSIVILHNTVFGKPADAEEAKQMVGMLAGHNHLVITGVFIGNHQQGVSFSDYTSVWIAPMTPEEIDFYVAMYKPLDKAGAYGIQDWLGWAKVERIEGSFANVMGLPVHKVYATLQSWNSKNTPG